MTIAWMNPQRIHTLTIHCTATPEGRDNSAEEIRRWDIDRFGQPSYHYVVELDGKIVKHLDDSQRGAHTAKANTGNIGVSYVGGTTKLKEGGKPKDTRTPLQKRALLEIVQAYRKRFPNIKVMGHRDHPGVAKACPSFDVRSWLKSEGIDA